jgi:hypothetical protein
MNDHNGNVSTEELLLAIHGPIGAKMTTTEIIERLCYNLHDVVVPPVEIAAESVQTSLISCIPA